MTISMFFVHTASVQTYQSGGQFGSALAAAVDDPCFLDEGQQLAVTDAGQQVTEGRTVLYAALSSADLYAPNSLVTVNGRQARVTSVRRRSSGGLGLPDHVEVELT